MLMITILTFPMTMQSTMQFVAMITILAFPIPMITILTFPMLRTTKYTAGYQHLVDAYGVNSYREVRHSFNITRKF